MSKLYSMNFTKSRIRKKLTEKDVRGENISAENHQQSSPGIA